MSAYRLGKDVTDHFNSFEEVAKMFGCKPVSRKTRNEKRLLNQRERFYKKHKCKACGQFMTYISDTNVMTCTNPECDGIKNTFMDKDGNERVVYSVSFDELDEKGSDIARNILS